MICKYGMQDDLSRATDMIQDLEHEIGRLHSIEVRLPELRAEANTIITENDHSCIAQ